MSHNNETNVHQGHGNHMAPFFEDGAIFDYLNTMLQESTPENSIDIEVASEDPSQKSLLNVISLLYNSDHVGFLSLLISRENQDGYDFVSTYPYLNGITHEVEIKEIFEWDNGLEANVKCVYRNEEGEDFEFWIFCTDYYINQHRYEEGAKLKLNLVASALYAEQGSLGFEFIGQSAIDFLLESGEEPTYDENGEVKPVEISTAETVAFIPYNDEVPDIAQFMSPIQVIATNMSFFDTKISCGEILIHRDPNLKVMLYYNSECDIEEGYPIMGNLWLSGRIAEE